MSAIQPERVTAQLDGEIAVVLVGVSAHAWWKPWRWWPARRALMAMKSELENEEVVLGQHLWSGSMRWMLVQYWRSFADLETWSKDAERSHIPAWADFNSRFVGGVDLGVWHETYLIDAGSFECVYSSMPPWGLAAATTTIPATGRLAKARNRLQRIRDGEGRP